MLPALLLVAGCDRRGAETPQARAPGEEGAAEGPALPDASGYQGQEMGRVSIDYRGMAAPDAPIGLPGGQDGQLSDFEGRPLLVNLWATWCAPCIAELPTLEALAGRTEGELKVLTVSQDLQGAEVVTPFLAERGLRRLEPWLDPENAIMSALGIESLPVTILYDSDGAELFRVYGGMDWNGERAQRLIDGALGR
ncbi:MAG: TlpA family protein disulfide reductase [Sphingomonadaceae bacterium]|nr:TlpA family protein disulfide reductase [Sphingomonadaceae bacterium]